jgi:hypothetical protein
MTRLEAMILYFVIYPGTLVPLVCVHGLALRWRVSPVWFKVATVLGVVLSAVRLYFFSLAPGWNFDHKLFRRVGLDVWAGIDPYETSRFWTHPFLNPPSTLPLFASFALLPEGLSGLTATFTYSGLALGLALLARSVLAAQDEQASFGFTWYELGALAAVVALSDASTAAIHLGQLPVLAAFVIYAALYSQAMDRPVAAGVFLGLGTMKIGTLLPFLLLFQRRGDRATWFTFGASVLLLCCVIGHPERLPEQSRALLGYIAELSKPGAVNDISYAGQYDEAIVGFDHAFYRLGIRNQRVLKGLQFVALGLLGTVLALGIRKEKIPRGLSCSLVSLYSLLFLYHRVYDSAIFALPLVDAAGRSKMAISGRSRALFTGSMLFMLGVMFMRRKALAYLTNGVQHWPVIGRPIEVLILPHGTWFTLLAMLLLWLGVRHEQAAGRAAAGVLKGGLG